MVVTNGSDRDRTAECTWRFTMVSEELKGKATDARVFQYEVTIREFERTAAARV